MTPLLTALAYLYENNLTIDKLWTETDEDDKHHTHIRTKPRGIDNPQAGAAQTVNIYELQQALPNCVICHKPKPKPGYTTCLKAKCLKKYLFND